MRSILFASLLYASACDGAVVHDERDSAALNAELPAIVPSQVLDLDPWKLTLPVDTAHTGHPDEYELPELADYSSPYFHVDESQDAVVFRAHAGGATTQNSQYPRSELREMTPGGSAQARWSTLAGRHVMHIRQAIVHLPERKPQVIAGQIHDASRVVLAVRLQGRQLFLKAGGAVLAMLDPDYELGRIFDVDLAAGGGKLEAFYAGREVAEIELAQDDCYFKAGCYTLSNAANGDEEHAYAEVRIYELTVEHEW